MLRALIAGVLAVSAVAACKSKGDAPTAAVGAPAGKVVEVSGKVTATREGKTRELALGGEVFADDQVETSADATVTIELFHNNARWAVANNRKQRVDASLAWGLDKQQATKAVEHDTAAAGREGERSAADTAATARAAAPATEAQPAPAAEPAKETAATDKSNEEKAAPSGEPPGAGMKGGPMADEAGGGTTEMSRPKEEAGKSRTTTRESLPRPTIAKDAKLDVTAATGGETKVEVSARLRQLVEGKRAALKKCLDPQAPKVRIDVTVKGGVASVTLAGDGNITDKVRSCAEAVIVKLDLNGLDGSTSIDFR